MKRIDFLWFRAEGKMSWESERYEVLSNVDPKDKVYLSDHRAVFADLKSA